VGIGEVNPLSALTYYRRHKRGTLLLVGLVGLMTLGVCVMVRLIDSYTEVEYSAGRYLSRVSLVSAVSPALDPGVVSQIRAHPDVAQVIQEKGLDIPLPPLASEYHLFGVSETDLPLLMEACDLHLKEGRLLRPHTNEIVLSQELATATGLRVGDQIVREAQENWEREYWYDAIPAPMELVGILQGSGIRLGFVSYEYVRDHESFGVPWRPGLVVIARPGRKASVDNFLETRIASPHAEVRTYRQLSEMVARVSRRFHVLFGVVSGLVAVVIALVVGMISQIAQTKRLGEFGVLHAVGHSKHRLARRLTLETACAAGAGWIVGLALAWGAFALLRARLYEPRGLDFDMANLTPLWFTAPIPLTAIVFVNLHLLRTLVRLDAVAIIERGKLGLEASARESAGKGSSANPLTSRTFYRRHRRRGLALIVTMGLMILGVAFPVFISAPMVDAMKPFSEPLRRASIVSPRTGDSVDPGVTAQIRSHPTVSHVIPAVELQLEVEVPPMGSPSISMYGVSENDLQTFIALYGLRIKEGRLPHPRSNEILLSESLALNRGLRVGDKIGPPLDKKDDDLLTEMVVAGILARSPGSKETDLWTGLASLEFLRGHELYAARPLSLLVVPTEGRKVELDAWLEGDVASNRTEVFTFEAQMGNYRDMTLLILLLFGIIESIIAIVAAIALAILSYTFFVQRREEFGILHALGHSRPWLILRTVRESVSVVAGAWLLGAAMCGIGLAYIQAALYAPKGLTLNFFNPTPWLFTLPIPLAVVAVSAGLVAWMLSRLDPVSIIEKR
jgi:ABC-type lipoprotein release transport system permease subunit